MTKGQKIWMWIIITLVVVITGLIIWANNIWKKLAFKPYFISADLHGLTLADIPAILISGEERTITAQLGMQIINASNTSIPFCYLQAVLSYKGIEIARTSDKLASACSTIPAKDTLNVADEVTVKLNKGGLQLLTDKFLGKNPEIDYRIDLSVFGIPITKIFPIKSKFSW